MLKSLRMFVMEHNMVAMSGHDVYKSTLSRLKTR